MPGCDICHWAGFPRERVPHRLDSSTTGFNTGAHRLRPPSLWELYPGLDTLKGANSVLKSGTRLLIAAVPLGLGETLFHVGPLLLQVVVQLLKGVFGAANPIVGFVQQRLTGLGYRGLLLRLGCRHGSLLLP